MMELRDFRLCVAIEEERHFGRAAARLGLQQPPVSRMVARLEARLGFALFERTTRSVRPTFAGAVFCTEARRVLAAAQAASDRASAANAGMAGTLRLGFSGSTAYAVLPAALRAFRSACPDVRVEPREMPIDVQRASLAAGTLDLGLARVGDGVDAAGAEPVFAEPHVAALPRGHPAAARPLVRLAALADSPFVVFPPGAANGFNAQVVSICQAAGFTPRIGGEIGQMPALIGLVGAGIGVSVVPASVRKLRFPGVVYRRLADAGAALSVVYVVTGGAPSTPVAARFITCLRATLPPFTARS